MNGPYGLKADLWLYAKEEGLNLDELVVSRWGKEDPYSKKSRFEILMAQSGVTVEDLKNADRGEFGDPEDDYRAADLKKAARVATPASPPSKYVDPCVKAKRFNKKLDWTDLPYIYPDDPWTTYPDPPDDPEEEEEGPALITPCKRTNDGEIKKKKDDDDHVPTTLLATTTGAAGDDMQMDDEIKKNDEDDVYVYNKRLRPSRSDKLQMDDYQERGGGG